eukprot:scaffold126574_cov48-Attheya_sp.AAC.1
MDRESNKTMNVEDEIEEHKYKEKAESSDNEHGVRGRDPNQNCSRAENESKCGSSPEKQVQYLVNESDAFEAATLVGDNVDEHNLESDPTKEPVPEIPFMIQTRETVPLLGAINAQFSNSEMVEPIQPNKESTGEKDERHVSEGVQETVSSQIDSHIPVFKANTMGHHSIEQPYNSCTTLYGEGDNIEFFSSQTQTAMVEVLNASVISDKVANDSEKLSTKPMSPVKRGIHAKSSLPDLHKMEGARGCDDDNKLACVLHSATSLQNGDIDETPEAVSDTVAIDYYSKSPTKPMSPQTGKSFFEGHLLGDSNDIEESNLTGRPYLTHLEKTLDYDDYDKMTEHVKKIDGLESDSDKIIVEQLCCTSAKKAENEGSREHHVPEGVQETVRSQIDSQIPVFKAKLMGHHSIEQPDNNGTTLHGEADNIEVLSSQTQTAMGEVLNARIMSGKVANDSEK